MLCSLQENKNRQWPGSSFCQFQLCNRSCWLQLDKTAVTLRARRDLQSSGIKLQHPNRGSFRSSDGNQTLLKGSSGLPETQTHTLGYCCSSWAAYWSWNCLRGTSRQQFGFELVVRKKYINTYFVIWASYTLLSVYVIRQSVPAPSPGWILTYMYIYICKGCQTMNFFNCDLSQNLHS